ncbi:energy-coupling factor ABC transporter substrate-binding protein [Desulfitobacterium sp. Sab5]|uniref:energy-coupling factor ABC transporter substrate-binding protein n=1 Tax=Desulfitobacterium nosdiversum TaxID=3375356 RepID=UPI003CF6ECD9
MKPYVKNSLLAICAVLIIFMPLVFSKGEFIGADDKATTAIQGIDPNYQPWFKRIYQPPGSEVESLLFAVQAAAGSGIVCFYLGYKKGQKKSNSHERKVS